MRKAIYSLTLYIKILIYTPFSFTLTDEDKNIKNEDV